MIRAVTYDLDGTLIDSTEAIVESFMHTFDVIGEPRPPREVIVRGIGHIIEDQFAQMTDRDPHECVRIYRAHYGKICCGKTFLLPGAAEGLAELQAMGLKLAFATSKRLSYAELILDHLGVLGYFESRIGPDEVAHPKPHPEAVLKSLEGLGVDADEMFFVGDTYFDVYAARDAGVRCLCVSTGYNTHEELESFAPEAVFRSLFDVTGYIANEVEANRRGVTAAPAES